MSKQSEATFAEGDTRHSECSCCEHAAERIATLKAEKMRERERRWFWETKAKERWALRRELEEALGFTDRDTYDEEKFRAAVEKVKAMMARETV